VSGDAERDERTEEDAGKVDARSKSWRRERCRRRGKGQRPAMLPGEKEKRRRALARLLESNVRHQAGTEAWLRRSSRAPAIVTNASEVGSGTTGYENPPNV